MIHPRIDELLDNVDSRYALVIVAAKRARQINDYHHQLGEGIGFDDAPPPLVESRSKNYLTMALEEISEGKLKCKYRSSSTALVASSAKGQNSGMARRARSASPVGSPPTRRCELVRLLVKGGHEVVPLVTPGAERFVRAETFSRARAALARRGRLRPPDRAPTCSSSRR